MNNGWLSVMRQRSVYEKCAGRPRYLVVQSRRFGDCKSLWCVLKPIAVDEMRWSTIALTPGLTVDFGSRAGFDTDDKSAGAYDMPIFM